MFGDSEGRTRHEETASCATGWSRSASRGTRQTSWRLAPDPTEWPSGGAPPPQTPGSPRRPPASGLLQLSSAACDGVPGGKVYTARQSGCAAQGGGQRWPARPAAKAVGTDGHWGPLSGRVGGHSGFAALMPYHTHQGLALPIMHPDVTHGLLHPGRCLSGGTLCKVTMPSHQVRGLLLQVRTHVLNDELRDMFCRWYPSMQTRKEPGQQAA